MLQGNTTTSATGVEQTPLAPRIVEEGRKQGMNFRLSEDGKVALLICPIDGKTVIARYGVAVTCKAK